MPSVPRPDSFLQDVPRGGGDKPYLRVLAALVSRPSWPAGRALIEDAGQRLVNRVVWREPVENWNR